MYLGAGRGWGVRCIKTYKNISPINPTIMETAEHTEISLESIKNKIEQMSKLQHIEVLKILRKNKSVKLNENKNGVYVNISFLPDETIHDLEVYIKYIDDQTKILDNNT
jgi:hypothetical protein